MTSNVIKHKAQYMNIHVFSRSWESAIMFINRCTVHNVQEDFQPTEYLTLSLISATVTIAKYPQLAALRCASQKCLQALPTVHWGDRITHG